MEKLIEQLLACTYALEYAAWNYGTMKLEDLDPNVYESTGVAETCLIEVRNTKRLIEEVRASQKANTGDSGLHLQRVRLSLPTKEATMEWWRHGKGDENFWRHIDEWSNQEVVNEIHSALTYFITKWQ